MGMIRPRRSRRPRPRRCPPRSPPLNPRHDALLTYLAGGPPPENLLPMLPGAGPAPQAPAPEPPAAAPEPPAGPGPLSLVRQNYHAHCEAAINKQINLELYASYVYLSIAFYFDRQDTALKHFASFFLWQSREEREQAQALMKLQNQRGGRLRLRDVRRPDRSQWESGLRAMKSALHVERVVNQSLQGLFQLASTRSDAHLCDFLGRHHLRQDVKFINRFGANIVELRRLGAPESSLAEYLFDKLALGASAKP
ncbi:ferritin heavy chain-like [Molossus molossus]|uniref:ferritin heavy chain-like n=1 Tax=Molossus molossus TaxID=27622 RepID=UPI00174666F0|nr:ferritin heavy chain-like [Molossus molossus]XP_036126043.1 ferritin heavy chain-like [Molossus molossus]